MTIVTTHYGKRPPRKQAKAAALEAPAIVRRDRKHEARPPRVTCFQPPPHGLQVFAAAVELAVAAQSGSQTGCRGSAGPGDLSVTVRILPYP
jgi:hypothetical protein